MAKVDITIEDLSDAQTLLGELINSGITEGDLALSCANMAYQGFDAKTILAVMKKYAEAAGISDDTHRRNLKTLAVLATLRGSKMSQIIGKSAEESKSWMNEMAKTYHIISKKPTTNTEVTLLRVAACMAIPLAVAIGSNALPIATTVDPETITPGYPKCMCLSTFGSLIPTQCLDDQDFKLLCGAYGEHQYQFDRIINSKDGKYSSITKIKQYMNIQINSTVYSQTQKIQALDKLGLISYTNRRARLLDSHRSALLAAATKFENRV